MKIIALQAENVKKLIAVEIRPDGNLVQITGKNGHGKTSVLDSIWWALAGASNIQATPIRTGAKTARIRLDLGEIVVTRTFKTGKSGGATSSIKVESKDGASFKSPQSMLDDLLGALSFDPLAFAKMPPRGQFDTLKKFAPGINFDHMEELTKAEFEKRAEINRKAKDLRSQAEGIQVPDDVPEGVVDEAEIINSITSAGAHNGEISTRQVRREEAAKKVKEIRARADKLKSEASELEEEAAKLQGKIDAAPELPAAIDVDALKSKLNLAKTGNAAVVAQHDKMDLTEKAEKLEAEAEELTTSMATREEEKKKAISEAQLPVKGISFGVGEVLMDGVPFDQASDAEQLGASIGIAMSLNPKLRVIRVRDGSLLDEDSMKLLGKMADEKDYQVWIERVDGSGKVGFVMEDGAIKKSPAKSAAKAKKEPAADTPEMPAGEL